MKLFFRTLLFLPLLLPLSCKSEGKSAATSTVSDLKTLQTELEKGRKAVKSAVATLNDLQKEGGDMAAEYAAFCKAVDTVQSQRDRVNSIRGKLAERREAFVKSWEQSLAGIQNASMRERAAKRRDAVVERFEGLGKAGDETKAEFDAWFKDLTDVRKILEFDLNTSGVESLSKEIKSIGKRAEDIDEKLEDYAEDIGELAKALEAAKPPPPEEGAKS